jgi:M6 family metalloprotease-like protein
MMKSCFAIIFCLLPLLAFAANFDNLPTQVVQPDGSVLDLFASGDEYANRLHDAQGYSIIQSPQDGFYYYAIRENGEPAPSRWHAGSSDPAALGLTPGINISPRRYREKVESMNSHARSGSRGPNTGTVNNLVVYIKFSDQTEFSEPRSAYDAKFNADGDDQYSLRNFFHQASYDQLNYVSNHYPSCAPETNLSYTDSHPRAYYMPYNAITNPTGYRDYQRADREFALLTAAINSIAAQVPSTLNIDADNDNYVDNVCFIIRGPHTAWADLLWAHRWVMYDNEAFINGKMVWDFTLQPENQNSVRTLCHEMFHSAGAPDLYHYDFDGITPAGCWDVMESGYAHMGMYMKYKYGSWINDIPIISPGTHTLQPVTSPSNNACCILLSNGEYLVLEYRKQGADIFEEALPGSGLLIYRINPYLDGNADGPPDEVYVFRPGGTQSVNGSIFDAAFSAQNHSTEFNQYTDPACVLTNGNTCPVNIYNITEAGETISFSYSLSNAYPPVIGSVSPADGTNLVAADQILSASVSAPSNNLSSVEFYCDSQLLGTCSATPYEVALPMALLTPGFHDLEVRALASDGLASTELSRVRVVDPQQETWFSWMSDSPAWDEYGRGAVPIQVALDLDLGDQEYEVKKIAFNWAADPWGLPAQPGLINAKINRFSNGTITNLTLLNIGDIVCPADGRIEYPVNSVTTISGQVAVILNMYEYQNIRFDMNGACGHSWATEPDRPWTDALGRGMLGCADIELQLQAPGSPASDPTAPTLITGLRVSPNPFSANAELNFMLREPKKVELAVFNIRGQKVFAITGENLGKGAHSLVWDGRDLSGRQAAPGIYFCRLQAGNEVFTARMALIR